MQISNRVIGHRGAAAYAPENTLVAFDKALALGCQCIEFDVMLSLDGEPFVFHDESLKRTTNGQGDLGLVDAAYLQTLDAGKWFSRDYKNEKIPHFRDVLQWLIFADINANIEIKPYPGMAKQTATTVMTYLSRYWPQQKPLPLISSFSIEALYLCRHIGSEVPLGLLMHEWDDNWLIKAQELQCYSIHLYKRELSVARVQAIKAQGYQLFVYTVNNKRHAQKLLDNGIDAIFSDYPDLLG